MGSNPVAEKKKRMGVVILHWRDAKMTQRCLNAVQKQNWPLSVAVVAPDKLPPLRGSFRPVVVPRNLGYGAGMNQGARVVADGVATYLFLNNDVILFPGACRILAAAFAADRRLGAAGIVLRERRGKSWQHVYGGGLLRRWIGKAELFCYPAAATDLDYVHGACVAIRAAAFEEVGGWRENLFLYGEDLWMGIALRKRKWKLGVVRAYGVHLHCAENLAAKEKIYYLVRNVFWVARTTNPSSSRLILLMTSGGRLVWHRLSGKEEVWRGLWDGWRGELGRCKHFR